MLERTIYQSASAVPGHAFREAGTFEEWRHHVAEPCQGNSRLVFVIIVAFAAPCLYLTNEESGGIHFVGRSSLGKTTALDVAGSVWGGGPIAGYKRQWRATANGLEGVAALHSDALLVLDEISQIDSREAAEVAYLLANGQGKARSRRDGTSWPPATWRILFLSSGEITIADKIAEDGRRRASAGQQVRVLDIPADAGAGYGLFENIHDAKNGDDFSRRLRTTAGAYYGTAIRRFLAELTDDPEAAAEWLNQARAEFLKQVFIPGADGQISRAIGRFGLIAAAGELAIELKILPWAAGDANASAATCFEAWLNRRGTTGPAEIENGIAQVRKFFEQHGEDRFQRFEGEDDDQRPRITINRCGFKRSAGVGGIEFFVLPESLKEICAGFDRHALERELIARKALIPDANGKPSKSLYIPALAKSARVYHFAPAIIEGGE
jgi:uncharacterized protein (DUF927 family)